MQKSAVRDLLQAIEWDGRSSEPILRIVIMLCEELVDGDGEHDADSVAALLDQAREIVYAMDASGDLNILKGGRDGLS